MKKILIPIILAILALPGTTYGQPLPPPNPHFVPLFDTLAGCNLFSVKATEYSVLADASDPKDPKKFDSIVIDDVQHTTTDTKGRVTLLKIGAIAWKYRGLDPAKVGMVVYNSCVKRAISAAELKEDKKLSAF